MKPYDEPIVIDEPLFEPITLDEAKMATRVYGSEENNLLRIYISAARRQLESATGRTFRQKTLEWSLDCWPCARHIELPRATPLISISSVKYTDSEGTETTWDSGDYIADTTSNPGRLVLGYNKTWPSFIAAPANAVKIRYKAGVANTYPLDEDSQTDIQADAKTAMLLMVGTLYANRESEVMADSLAKHILRLPVYRKFVDSLIVTHEYSDQ